VHHVLAWGETIVGAEGLRLRLDLVIGSAGCSPCPRVQHHQSEADLIGGRGSLRCSRQRVSSWMTQRLAWRFEDRVMMTSCD
jgi:hypothetical protein